MRFGCCLNMVAAGLDGTGIEKIEQLAKAGYDYVELPLAEITTLSDIEFDALNKRVSQSGIRCDVCNNFFPKTMRLTGPEVDNGRNHAFVERALGRAAALGAVYVVFGSGGAKNVPVGFPLAKGYRQVVELLRTVSPLARRYGITVVIEPLRKAECNLINNFSEGCLLAADVDCENVRVLIDYFHHSEEHETVEALARHGRRFLRHVHFAHGEERVYPKTLDEAGSLPFFNALKGLGYDARISVEAYSSRFEEDAALALQFLQEQFHR